MNELIYSKKI